MPTSVDVDQLQNRRQQLLAEIASIGDLRPGTLTERYRKCGKANCHCASEPTGGHGPSFSLSRQVNSKTVTRIIPKIAVEETRHQIAECQRLRALTNELIEVSERLCDAKLRAKRSAETATAEKGGSRERSKRRSRSRSKR